MQAVKRLPKHEGTGSAYYPVRLVTDSESRKVFAAKRTEMLCIFVGVDAQHPTMAGTNPEWEGQERESSTTGRV